MTSLSLLVPTHREDRPLARCLDSVWPQLGPEDEVLVIGDTHDGPLPKVEALVAGYGLRFRYLTHDAGHHDFGHSQLNYGISQARGEYVHVNDDDDVWAPDALAAMRQAIAADPGVPLLFRFTSYHGPTYWEDPVVREGLIGGHCAVFPKDGHLGRWGARYQGDFDYIKSTLDAWAPTPPVFVDHVVAVARP